MLKARFLYLRNLVAQTGSNPRPFDYQANVLPLSHGSRALLLGIVICNTNNNVQEYTRIVLELVRQKLQVQHCFVHSYSSLFSLPSHSNQCILLSIILIIHLFTKTLFIDHYTIIEFWFVLDISTIILLIRSPLYNKMTKISHYLLSLTPAAYDNIQSHNM